MSRISFVIGLVFSTHRVHFTAVIIDIQPDGQVQGQSVSDVDPILSYVHCYNSDPFTFPLLAVTIDQVDKSLFDWSDPGYTCISLHYDFRTRMLEARALYVKTAFFR